MPWESWPARLALTQPTATALASSSVAPAALSNAVPIRLRRSGWTIGMGFPLEPPARDAGLACCQGASSQTPCARARPENRDRHAHSARQVLGFHGAE